MKFIEVRQKIQNAQISSGSFISIGKYFWKNLTDCFIFRSTEFTDSKLDQDPSRLDQAFLSKQFLLHKAIQEFRNPTVRDFQ